MELGVVVSQGLCLVESLDCVLVIAKLVQGDAIIEVAFVRFLR